MPTMAIDLTTSGGVRSLASIALCSFSMIQVLFQNGYVCSDVVQQQ
jgi:hypothetical protein